MTTTRKTYTPKFKARVAMEAVRGEKTLSELGSQFKVHPIQMSKWRKTAVDQLPELFADGRRKASDNGEVETTALPSVTVTVAQFTNNRIPERGEQTKNTRTVISFPARTAPLGLLATASLLRFRFGHELTLAFAVQFAALVILLGVLGHPDQSTSLARCDRLVRRARRGTVLVRWICCLKRKASYRSK